jgi:hypothetical protein
MNSHHLILEQVEAFGATYDSDDHKPLVRISLEVKYELFT